MTITRYIIHIKHHFLVFFAKKFDLQSIINANCFQTPYKVAFLNHSLRLISNLSISRQTDQLTDNLLVNLQKVKPKFDRSITTRHGININTLSSIKNKINNKTINKLLANPVSVTTRVSSGRFTPSSHAPSPPPPPPHCSVFTN